MSDNQVIEGAEAQNDPATGGDPAAANPAAGEQTGGELAQDDGSADQLALIAAKLAELGLVEPDESYLIGDRTVTVLQSMTDRIARLDTELAAANDELAKAAATLAEPKSAPAAKPARARKIDGSAVKLKREGAKEERDQELLELIGAAGTVEIAFSNGKTEIAALPPVRIMGNAWRATMVGVQLTIPELLIHGPQPGTGAHAINGYGLYLDGELAAYMERGEQLTVPGGSTQNVAPDIVF